MPTIQEQIAAVELAASSAIRNTSSNDEIAQAQILAHAALRAAVETLRAAEWKPIESAPMGEEVLVMRNGAVSNAVQDSHNWRSSGWSGYTPTHWRHIDPPQEAE